LACGEGQLWKPRGAATGWAWKYSARAARSWTRAESLPRWVAVVIVTVGILVVLRRGRIRLK